MQTDLYESMSTTTVNNLPLEGPYGHFDTDSAEYVITRRRTPRPWINYIWNKEFLSLVTQNAQGFGFHQDPAARRTNIIHGRRIYLQDAESGTTWMADGMDAASEPEAFEARHGLGYTTISLTCHGIASRLRLFIPHNANAEVWSLRLENTGDRTRKLRVVAVLDSRIDGEPGLQGYYTRAETHFVPELAAVVHLTHLHENGNPPRAFLATTADVTGYDCRHDTFQGTLSRDTLPEALRAENMGNSDRCEFEKGVFALETRIELSPTAARTLHFFGGHYRTTDDIAAMREGFASDGAVDKACEQVRASALAFPQTWAVETGEPLFDHWCNIWLKRQLAYNATWARDYFNGYRDLCQDVENLVILDPLFARTKLREILSYQYPSGFAPRAWLNGEALDHGHGDSPVWITYAVHALVMETGDRGLLDESVPYYGKDGDEGSVYDHCRRAMDWYWRDRGENGLCLMRKGDWNDALVRVGWDGKGTSVWTTQAYHRALLEFAELARLTGRLDDAATADQRARVIRETLETVAWDGDHYICGFTDDGRPVGAEASGEGTLYANNQSWAVIGRCASPERARQAMDSLERDLETPQGVLTMRDLYTKFDPGIGPVTGQRPGAYQNGSVYSHSNAFKLTADCMLGRREEAWRGLWKILPFSPDRRVAWGEPYVMPNCYFGPAAGYRHDQPGQSWKTGTAGWILRLLSHHIFGLQPSLEGLRIKPCLPAGLRTCCITRRFRGTTYRVSFVQEHGEGEVHQISVEGEVCDSETLPVRSGAIIDVLVRL